MHLVAGSRQGLVYQGRPLCSGEDSSYAMGESEMGLQSFSKGRKGMPSLEGDTICTIRALTVGCSFIQTLTLHLKILIR